jgi:transposase
LECKKLFCSEQKSFVITSVVTLIYQRSRSEYFHVKDTFSGSIFYSLFKKIFMQNRDVKMEVINPNAAGIDVGSRSHFAAIGQGKEEIREYGVYNEDHRQLIKWFLENEIKTVAMESTGTYWQNLYSALIAAGFQVILCNGNLPKTSRAKRRM